MNLSDRRIFEPIGYNLLTPYEELIHNGVFDDVIGGANNRHLAVVENDLMVTRILEEYREIAANLTGDDVADIDTTF